MILAADPVLAYQPTPVAGMGGWWSDISDSVGDAIGKFSTAGATRIIAQPGVSVSTRNADGSSTTISRSGLFNPSPTLGVDIPAVQGTSSSTLILFGAFALIAFMVVNRR